MMIMVFVTFRAAVFMKVEVTTLNTPSTYSEPGSVFWLPWQQHSNSNWSHSGDVNPEALLDKTGVLTSNIER